MTPLQPVPPGEPAEGPPGPGLPADALARLLARCARGDRDAFAAWYEATASRAYGLALRVVRDPAQAEEVVQDAFLETWRAASRFDPERGSPLAWLLTITHRKAVDRVRAAEAATRRDTTYHRQLHEPAHDATAEAAQSSLEARRVRAALAALTPAQREAIELAYFGGYTHSEVAALLQLPLGTAKTRIRDGLIRLRDQLGTGEHSRGGGERA